MVLKAKTETFKRYGSRLLMSKRRIVNGTAIQGFNDQDKQVSAYLYPSFPLQAAFRRPFNIMRPLDWFIRSIYGKPGSESVRYRNVCFHWLFEYHVNERRPGNTTVLVTWTNCAKIILTYISSLSVTHKSIHANELQKETTK